jgi:hypothetical protein
VTAAAIAPLPEPVPAPVAPAAPAAPEAQIPAGAPEGETGGLAQETYERARATLAEKVSEATGGLDLDEEESKAKQLIEENKNNTAQETDKNIQALDDQIEAAIQEYNDALDADADEDTLENLDQRINDLKNSRENLAMLNSIFGQNVQSEGLVLDNPDEDPKSKQEAQKRIDKIQGRLDRMQKAGGRVNEDLIAGLEDELDRLETLRDTLPDVPEQEEQGEKDGGKSEESGDGAGAGGAGEVPGEVSGPTTGANLVRQGHTLRDSDGNVVGTSVKPAASAERHKADGRHVPDLFEVPQTQAELFRNRLIAAAEANKFGSAVTIHDLEYYQQPGVRLFMTQDGGGGVALNDDEIVTGFMHPNAQDAGKGSIISMVDKMVELGGRRLDAFDTVLPRYYAMSGFKAVARIPFDPEQAPDNWDTELYGDYNNGAPDVVFMVFDPNHPLGAYSTEDGEYVDDYDAGLAKQAEALALPTDETADTKKKKQADTNSREQEKQRVLNELDALRGTDNLDRKSVV